MSSLKRMLFVALATALPSLALAQPSQGWPEHTVRLITSSPAGGSADIVARLFAERLSTSWRASVIVENRPGADGMIAIQAVLGATDGHTLLAAPSSNVTVTPAIRKVPYKNEDLRPLPPIATELQTSLEVRLAPSATDIPQARPGRLIIRPRC